jgi:galactose mutarotase-like enzyme
VKVTIGNETFSAFPDRAKTGESITIPVRDRKICISMPERRINMLLGESFKESSKLVLWTDAPDKYFCVEPIIEDRGMFDTKAGQHLKQGQSLQFTVSFFLNSRAE